MAVLDGEDADPEAPGRGGHAGMEAAGRAGGSLGAGHPARRGRMAAGGASGVAAKASSDHGSDGIPSRAAARSGSASSMAAGARSSSSTAAGSDEWQEGMDPNSTYKLEIKLLGNPKKSRKDVGYYVYERFVDSDMTNYMDLVEFVVTKFPPRYLEVAHLHYYDEVLKSYPEVISDQDLMFMFEKHSKTKVVSMFIVYWHPSEPYEPKVWQTDVQMQANSNIEQDEENIEEDEGNTEEDEDNTEEDTYLCNPLPENEHVGVDEEIMYLEDAPVQVVKIKKRTRTIFQMMIMRMQLRWRVSLGLK
ncbi:unnamed protein product [Urochloa humidicola]